MLKIYNKVKAEQVIELYLQNKTVREIAKIVHMSFSDIGEIIRDFEERKAKENLKGDTINSEETKAVDLFSQGKTPIEVKVSLDLSTEDVETYYTAFWKLNKLHQLYNYYENDIKSNLSSFLKLYRKAKELGIQNDDVVRALRYLKDIAFLAIRHEQLIDEIKEKEIKKDHILYGLDELEASIYKFKNSIE